MGRSNSSSARRWMRRPWVLTSFRRMVGWFFMGVRVVRASCRRVLAMRIFLFPASLPLHRAHRLVTGRNFFLLSGETAHKAATMAARARGDHLGASVAVPSLGAIENKIDEFGGAGAMRDVLQPQWLARYLQESGNYDAGKVKQGFETFERLWSNPRWRRRCCSGKKLLASLRQWVKDSHKLNLSLSHLLEAYQPEPEVHR